MNPLKKGAQFVRDNPQLLYTIFLAVAIPLAFLYTSDKFLAISRGSVDAVERNRIGILQDAVSVFLPAHMNTEDLNKRFVAIGAQNPIITSFWVLQERADATGTLEVIASMDTNKVSIGPWTPDPYTAQLINVASGQPETSIAKEIIGSGGRAWRVMRTVRHPAEGIDRAYIITDVSAAKLDQAIESETYQAYLVLAAVILGVMLLLGRQARITDYASLYEKLEEVDKMKDDFVSMAAHELRSPLTTIRGYADLIRGVQPMNEKGEEMLVRIEHAANDLNNLIGDILDVARLQEGRMSFAFEALDAEPIILEVVDAFKKPATDKGLSISYAHEAEGGPLPKINADPTRLRQVVVNFVGNAVKYTPAGSVKVITRTIKGPQEMIEIRISDTGLGISSEAQKHLTEKFYRVKTAQTSKIVGTGLGLWITKEIVEKMNGTIAVESIEGKGSDFIVRFPVARA